MSDVKTTETSQSLKDTESDGSENRNHNSEDAYLWESNEPTNKERFCVEYSPSNWRVTTFECEEETDTPPARVVWIYLPGRLVTVRINSSSESDSHGEGPTYTIEKSNSKKTATFHPPESTFAAALTLAQQLMRGWCEISLSEFRNRLGISAAAWRVQTRMEEWNDLEKIAYKGRFDHIEGVDAEANHRLWQAINGPFLNKSREEITRVVEDNRTEGVYATVPALGGWKVQKEWHCYCEPDCSDVLHRVLMPLSADGGRLYTDKDAAIDAAKAFTEDRIRTLEQSNQHSKKRYRAKDDVPLLTGGLGQPDLFDFID